LNAASINTETSSRLENPNDSRAALLISASSFP
jgi:hypothetical protein